MATGKICRIDGCTNILTRTSGQICQAHRSRWFRHKTYDLDPNWVNLKKGQPCLAKSGYVRINIDGQRVLQHRHIMEQHLGRALTKDERVHHRNHNKADNRIENLELMDNNGTHMRTHHGDSWRKRKTNPPYPARDIKKIIERARLPTFTFSSCFCGGKYEAKNLCSKHYQWAYKHKFV